MAIGPTVRKDKIECRAEPVAISLARSKLRIDDPPILNTPGNTTGTAALRRLLPVYVQPVWRHLERLLKRGSYVLSYGQWRGRYRSEGVTKANLC